MKPASSLTTAVIALSASLIVLSSARAHEHAEPGHAAPTVATDPSPTAPVALPALRASWRVHFEGRDGVARAQTWQLRRGVDRLVWSKGEALDEVWTRSPSGVALERVMHPQRHVIEYTPGELRTLGIAVEWRELGTLFAERDLRALTRVQDKRLPMGLVRYRGALAGEQVDLVWDTRALLPVKLAHTGSNGRVRYALEGVAMGAVADGPADVRAAGYTRIDAADFGDMEHDPVVRLAQVQDERRGWRRAHRH